MHKGFYRGLCKNSTETLSKCYPVITNTLASSSMVLVYQCTTVFTFLAGGLAKSLPAAKLLAPVCVCVCPLALCMSVPMSGHLSPPQKAADVGRHTAGQWWISRGAADSHPLAAAALHTASRSSVQRQPGRAYCLALPLSSTLHLKTRERLGATLFPVCLPTLTRMAQNGRLSQ